MKPSPNPNIAVAAPVEKPIAPPESPNRFRVGARLRAWLETLHHDPTAEEEAAEERRQRLLNELNRAVADAPEDTPIKDVIRQLHRHWDD